ncbi:MAG: VOC family protein [Rhizobacter sp.]|nr:VOC family protein [Bacteriovorax sp.]
MAKIQGIGVVTIYTDDYDKAVQFYNKFLNFEMKAKIGEKGCWGSCGTVNIYIEGGNTKTNLVTSSTRTSVAFIVASIDNVFTEFKNGGVELIHTEPQKIGDEDWWFMFKDPSGNILEMFGEK